MRMLCLGIPLAADCDMGASPHITQSGIKTVPGTADGVVPEG